MTVTKWTKQKQADRAFRTRRLYLRRYLGLVKWPLTGGSFILLLSVLADLFGPFLVAHILDRELAPGTPWRPLRLLSFLTLFLAVTLLAALLQGMGNYRLRGTANRVTQLMQKDLFRHLQKLPLSILDRLPPGNIAAHIASDTSLVRGFFEQVLARLLAAVLYILGILIYLAYMDWRLSLLALIFLPLIILVLLDYRRKAGLYNRRQRQGNHRFSGSLNEAVQGRAVIRSLGKEDQVEGELKTINEEVFAAGKALSGLYAYSGYNITRLLQHLSFLAALAYFGYCHFTQTAAMPVGQLYVFIDYMTKLFDQVSGTMMRIGDMERSFSAADQIFSFLDIKEESELDRKTAEPAAELDRKAAEPAAELDRKAAKPAAEQPHPARRGRAAGGTEPCLRFERLSFSYTGKGEPVLDKISLSIEEGSKVAFVGATGAGKSTLINLILKFYEPCAGEIFLRGKAYSRLTRAEVRSSMAIVLQTPYLFKGSLYRNISLDKAEISRERAEQALRQVAGDLYESSFPRGLDTPVRTGGSDFSAGERQLISFARALAYDPDILLLDEATASIDSATEAQVQRALVDLTSDRTTIVIAHRLSTIRDADCIFVMNEGKLVEAGDHAALLAADGLYRRLLAAAEGGLA